MESDIGRKLRQIRHVRGKSLSVVAGLAGISASYLSRLESGERALDRRSLITSLAEALEVAPTELTESTLGGAGEANEDGQLNEVRLALLGASIGEPRGQVWPVAGLNDRLAALLSAQQACRHAEVGQELPGLIRDTHETLRAGKHDGAVLRSLVLLHVQGTQAWLRDVGASLDLGWQAAQLAQQAAHHLDEPLMLGVAGFGVSHGLMAAGAFDLATDTLKAVSPGTATSEDMQLSGMLAFTNSLLAAAAGRTNERTPPLEHAAELAERTGEANALWFGFGPSNVAVWRMAVALECGEFIEAARLGASVDPRMIPSPTRKAAYWGDYGRALARIPKQRETAVRALRTAERISPPRVHKHPFTRSTLAELLLKTNRDAVGRELRGMAYRAGLHV
ncbi:Helix-turn-helix domain-containing protein [Actinopolyspora alba]|uniref:Helix-turn-helix domain-containing protein n=1 Tax=Actinopolyspora alba TaxID=673379 RepID=A0A1I1XA75_9ACTN|nr:helix-turn-helix transcriptional regulator [Actinopolyspora alba]SFE04316.1 Helix-turn-helix domain-containing protein [Actinopolyspora alba]